MHDISEITEEKIMGWVGQSPASRGKICFQRHRVLKKEVAEDGRLILGVVQGDDQQQLSVLIRRLSGNRMHGKCSCSSGRDCKHVAALLYAVVAEKQGNLFDVEAEMSAPKAFNRWLGMLGSAKKGRPISTGYPDSVKQRLLYILEPDGDRNVRLDFVSARILKSGDYGSSQPYNAGNILSHSLPRFILASDEKILREVAMDRSLSSMHGYLLKGEDGLTVLKRVMESGRCHWRNTDTPALKQGDRRSAEWAWQLNSMGDQYLTLRMPDQETIVPTSPPWYVDPEQNRCGPVKISQPADVAEIMLNIAPIELDCSDSVIDAVCRQLPADVPVPVRLQHVYRQVKPMALIRLRTMKIPHRWGHQIPDQCHLADLMFDYDGRQVPFSIHPLPVRIIKGERVIDYRRDLISEREAVEMLASAGLYPMHEDRLADHLDFQDHEFGLENSDYWPEWMIHEIPLLESLGLHIEISADFCFQVERARAWDLSLEHGDHSSPLMGQASFMVTLEGGEEIDLIDALARWVGSSPELLKAESLARLREKEHIPLPLPDGRLLPAPGVMVANILHFMMDVFAGGNSSADNLSAPQMLALQESLNQSSAPVRINSSVWLQQMKQLVDIGAIPVCSPPETLQAELRDYQHTGLSWLQFLRRMGLAGILADDMGLGKTVQALAHILKEKEEGRLEHPALVLAPTSLMHNWRRESEKFTPELSVLVLHGAERSRNFGRLATFDLVLTTYPLLIRDFEVLEGQRWHLLILDEAQYIKNPRAKAAQLVRRLTSEHRLCMTGTPMENHLGELWSQFDFLMPGYLYDMRSFLRLFRKPIEIEGDRARQDALNVRLRPFLLRRSKEDVALELPPKTKIIRSIEIEGAQRELYESVRLAMQGRVRHAIDSLGAARSQIVVLDALLKMRQVCCDPRLLGTIQGAPPESAKLKMLMEMLPEMIEEGRRVLLFSQFTSMLKLIEDEVSRQKIGYVKLTGKTKDRIGPIDIFQNGEAPLFLISLKAGGVGLNLTAADTVIHYDPWWNPAVEAQATDRAHRIGQEKAVFVYKLITAGTIEERILMLQERKRGIADAIYQRKAGEKRLWSVEELNSLFAPLQ